MKQSKKQVTKGKGPVAPSVKSQATPKQIRRDIREILLNKLSK